MIRTTEYSGKLISFLPFADGCPDGFGSINVGDDAECLMLKDGMETAASRLETRRYAALQGATTEWSKMEGFSYSALRRRAYVSMSNIRRGMEDHGDESEESDEYELSFLFIGNCIKNFLSIIKFILIMNCQPSIPSPAHIYCDLRSPKH